MSWSLEAAMAAMQLATQDELEAAMQSRPELRDRISGGAQPSTAASFFSAAPAPAQQGLQPVVLPSFGGLPPHFGMMPVGAPAFGGCLMAVPGPPGTAPAKPGGAQHRIA